MTLIRDAIAMFKKRRKKEKKYQQSARVGIQKRKKNRGEKTKVVVLLTKLTFFREPHK